MSQCPYRIQKLQEANYVEANDNNATVFLHETLFLNKEKVIPWQYEIQESDVCYLDNDSSNHMCGNHSFFSNLDEGITGKVKCGDHSCVKINGNGAISFQGNPKNNG